MPDQACSTCHDIAAVLLGGQCRACARTVGELGSVPREVEDAIAAFQRALHDGRDAGLARRLLRATVARCAPAMATSALRPLPPGAPEAVQQLAAECRAEGVPAGLLAEPRPLPSWLIEPDVCGVRAARWHGLSPAERRDALHDRDRSQGRSWPHVVACPGCGAAAGEPCRETVPQVDSTTLLVEQRDAALVQLDAVRRELATARHELERARTLRLADRAAVERAERELARVRAEALADAAQQRRILEMREGDARVAGDRWREELAHAEARAEAAERELARMTAARDEALAELRAGRDTL